MLTQWTQAAQAGFGDMECHIARQEVECYRLDLEELTFMHSAGTGTKLLDRRVDSILLQSCPRCEVRDVCGDTHKSLCWSLSQ